MLTGVGTGILHSATVDLATPAEQYTTVFGKMVDIVKGNEILMIFLFGGLLAMCWRHFRKAKGAVRG